MQTLSEYLLNRGLSLDPVEVDKKTDPILESPELTKEAAELWETKQPLLTMVFQARINAIANKILTDCVPQEVVVLRQALVEIGALVTDFEKYKGEYGRQTAKADKQQAEETPAEETQPEIKEGEESTL